MSEGSSSAESPSPLSGLLPGFVARTAPADRFSTASLELTAFASFVSVIAAEWDNQQTASQATARALQAALASLDSEASAQVEREAALPERPTQESAVEFLKSVRDLFFQLLYTRAVDNFLTYLSELLALAFRTRPEMLASAEKTLSIDDVLQHSDIDELLDRLLEERVQSLSFRGIDKLHEYLAKNYGLPIFAADDLADAVRIVETRNLFVHNRGIVNRRYADRVPAGAYNVGDAIPAGVHYHADSGKLLGFVFDIDTNAAEKWSLPMIRTPEEWMAQVRLVPMWPLIRSLRPTLAQAAAGSSPRSQIG